MRVCLIHADHRSGGAQIAGSRRPARVAHIGGALKSAGFDEVRFIAAMTDDLNEDALRAEIRRAGRGRITAITPSIHEAEHVLRFTWEEARSTSGAGCMPPSCTSRCCPRRPGST